jgi:hypothetical protein
VNLDTAVMLKAMVDQARIVVFRAVASITKTPLPVAAAGGAATSGNSSESGSSKVGFASSFSSNNSKGLTAFRSSLALSSAGSSSGESSPEMLKARSSALRLNNVLHGKYTATSGEDSKAPGLGQRRVRSVKWETPSGVPTLSGANDPDPKRARLSQTAAKLKSFKSFGRPHAGDFGSGPRNATFGEYGRPQNLWGRDGRLAHHPTPMDNNSGFSATDDDSKPVKNAIFDGSRRMFRSNGSSGGTGGGLGGGLGSSPRLGGASTQQSNGNLASIPRTATGLENWLMKKSTY